MRSAIKLAHKLTPVALIAAFLVLPASASGSPIQLTVNTSGLSGSGELVFDFAGDGDPQNSVTISSFATDGALGSPTTIGNVSGALPGVLTLNDNGSFFNE